MSATVAIAGAGHAAGQVVATLKQKQFAGLSNGYDQTLLRGDLDENKFACLYLKQGVLIAVDAINSPREFMQAKRLIAERAIIDPAKEAGA